VIVVTALCSFAAVWLLISRPADERCRALTDGGEKSRPASSAAPEPARLAATFDLVAAALDAGLPPGHALAVVAAAAPEGLRSYTRRITAMLELSAEPRVVWESLASDPHLGPLGSALARADQSGAPVAEAVRVLADESRRTDRSDRLERARRVGVRTAAPLGLCFLPAFLVVAVIPTVIGLIGDVF
jgi:pilus assembly protein TadC